MKTSLHLARLVALFFLGLALARAASLDGRWTAEFDTQVGLQKYLYDFKTGADGQLTGKAQWERMEQKGETPLSEVKLAGDAVSFVEMISVPNLELRVSYTGKLIGDELKLTRTVGDFGTEPLVAKRAASASAQIKIALIGEQTTHSLHRENDPEYPKFLGESLDRDFIIDATKPHPMGGGHLYGGGAKFLIGNFAHPQATILDHALSNPKSYLRSDELKLAEAFAPHLVVLGPFGDHEALAKIGFDNFTRDLRALLDRLAAFPSHPQILVALPIPHGPKDDDENYRRIRRETEQVAREKKLAIIDLWTPFLGHPEFYKDATHLTIPGRQQLAKVVAASLTVTKIQPPPPASARP